MHMSFMKLEALGRLLGSIIHAAWMRLQLKKWGGGANVQAVLGSLRDQVDRSPRKLFNPMTDVPSVHVICNNAIGSACSL